MVRGWRAASATFDQSWSNLSKRFYLSAHITIYSKRVVLLSEDLKSPIFSRTSNLNPYAPPCGVVPFKKFPIARIYSSNVLNDYDVFTYSQADITVWYDGSRYSIISKECSLNKRHFNLCSSRGILIICKKNRSAFVSFVSSPSKLNSYSRSSGVGKNDIRDFNRSYVSFDVSHWRIASAIASGAIYPNYVSIIPTFAMRFPSNIETDWFCCCYSPTFPIPPIGPPPVFLANNSSISVSLNLALLSFKSWLECDEI